MTIDYALQKLDSGLRALATCDEPLRDRLVRAFDAIRQADPEDIPPEKREEFIALAATVRRDRRDHEMGAVYATIHSMDDREAIAIADQVIDLYTHCHVARATAGGGR